MAEIRGTNGVIQIGSGSPVAVAKVKSFELSVSRARIETTAKGDEWKKSVKGLGSWTASGTCHVDFGEASQTTLRENLLSGTAATIGADVACAFFTGGAVSGEKKHSGNGVLTQFTLTSPEPGDGSPAEFSFEIEGNGAIAEAAAV
jgi:hypothetical protein